MEQNLKGCLEDPICWVRQGLGTSVRLRHKASMMAFNNDTQRVCLLGLDAFSCFVYFFRELALTRNAKAIGPITATTKKKGERTKENKLTENRRQVCLQRGLAAPPSMCALDLVAGYLKADLQLDQLYRFSSVYLDGCCAVWLTENTMKCSDSLILSNITISNLSQVIFVVFIITILTYL